MKRVCTYTGCEVAGAVQFVHIIREHGILSKVLSEFPDIEEYRKTLTVRWLDEMEVTIEEDETIINVIEDGEDA